MSLKSIVTEIEVSQYRIFCDLDGVLVDFDRHYEHFTGKSPEEADEEYIEQYGKKKGKQLFWEPIDALGTSFWEHMPWMKDGKALWGFIKPYKPQLLSSPSRSGTSRHGKKLWASRETPGTDLILKQAKEKHECCTGPKDIIIDDRPDTCQRWRDAGGIAIDHTSAKDTISKLVKLGFKSSVNEIKAVSAYTPKFFYVDTASRPNLWVSYFTVEKYCKKIIPSIDENYIDDIENGWVSINPDYQDYPEDINIYNRDFKEYIDLRLKKYKQRYINEIKAVPKNKLPNFFATDGHAEWIDWDLIFQYISKIKPLNQDERDNILFGWDRFRSEHYPDELYPYNQFKKDLYKHVIKYIKIYRQQNLQEIKAVPKSTIPQFIIPNDEEDITGNGYTLDQDLFQNFVKSKNLKLTGEKMKYWKAYAKNNLLRQEWDTWPWYLYLEWMGTQLHVWNDGEFGSKESPEKLNRDFYKFILANTEKLSYA